MKSSGYLVNGSLKLEVIVGEIFSKRVYKIGFFLYWYTITQWLAGNWQSCSFTTHMQVSFSKCSFMNWSRNSHQRCSLRKVALRNSAKFTGKLLCQSLVFNKVAGLRWLLLLIFCKHSLKYLSIDWFLYDNGF